MEIAAGKQPKANVHLSRSWKGGGRDGCVLSRWAQSGTVSDPADSLFDLDLSTPPHDGFFKAVFSDPDKAGAFFRKHLPESVTHRIEWSSLTVLPASFVKRDLQQNHSDLLFSVQLSGRETLLYLV